MKISAKSDIGKVRNKNEDTYAIGNLDSNVSYAVVCDGMGGHSAGEVASDIAVKTVVNEISSSFRAEMSVTSIKNMFFSAISKANITIFDEAEKKEALKGMGTTICIAVIADNNAYVAHVGDSRVYLVNKNNIKQITTDHSLVQQLVDAGIIDSSEAENHPSKNVITRALGIEEEVEFDFCQIELKKNDKIVICTDGLTNMINNDVICESIKDDCVHDYAQRLVDKANNAGGYDNVTVVVMVN